MRIVRDGKAELQLIKSTGKRVPRISFDLVRSLGSFQSPSFLLALSSEGLQISTGKVFNIIPSFFSFLPKSSNPQGVFPRY